MVVPTGKVAKSLAEDDPACGDCSDWLEDVCCIMSLFSCAVASPVGATPLDKPVASLDCGDEEDEAA